MQTITVTATELARNLGELTERVRWTGVRVLVERHGKPVAALVPAELVEREQREEKER